MADSRTTFDDLLASNRSFAESFDSAGLPAPAAQHVAVVTCMDSRIDPLAMLGLGLGDAKVIRNPGGQVTDDALVSVVLATTLLDCTRVMVVEHTKCAMASADDAGLRQKIADSTGLDASDITPGAIDDQVARITADLERIRNHELVPSTTVVAGFVYDVDTGLLEQVA